MNTVRTNGNEIFSGRLSDAEVEYDHALYALATPGDVISLRDANDKTLRKHSIDDAGRLVSWLD